jgi:nucleoside 2-deoxyribosyltransferase
VNKFFYLSTQKDRNDEASPLLEALEAKGWERSFNWSGREASSESEYADLAVAEIAGIRSADVVIVILPGGRGTHVEIGAALAMGKPIVLHAPNRKSLETPYPCAFHYHPTVKLVFSEQLNVDALLACIST